MVHKMGKGTSSRAGERFGGMNRYLLLMALSGADVSEFPADAQALVRDLRAAAGLPTAAPIISQAPQPEMATFEAFHSGSGKRCGHNHNSKEKADRCAARLSRHGAAWQVRPKA